MTEIDRFFYNLQQIYDIGMKKIRLGNPHDGGYVVIKEICERSNHLYSFGIGDNVSFEMDLVLRFPWIGVDMFDPSISAPPASPIGRLYQSWDFHQSTVGAERDWLDLAVMKNSILKMDVEFDEWKMFLNMPESVLGRFTMIVVEFHILHHDFVPYSTRMSPYFQRLYTRIDRTTDDSLFRTYNTVLQKIVRQFYPVHIHANNSLPPRMKEDWMFPPLLEVTFVRRDMVPGGMVTLNIHPTLPIEGLDAPNKTDRPDIYDGYPRKKETEHGIE